MLFSHLSIETNLGTRQTIHNQSAIRINVHKHHFLIQLLVELLLLGACLSFSNPKISHTLANASSSELRAYLFSRVSSTNIRAE